MDVNISKLSLLEPIARVVGSTAAVAVILSKSRSLLLIKRVERLGDPWSGNVAFPGGHVEARDASFFETAARETKEEVGLDVTKGARFLGYMQGFEPRNKRLWVVPCVFLLSQEAKVLLNQEASSYKWVPVKSISPANRYSYTLERGGRHLALPAFRFEDYLVWGLTERILTSLMELPE